MTFTVSRSFRVGDGDLIQCYRTLPSSMTLRNAVSFVADKARRMKCALSSTLEELSLMFCFDKLYLFWQSNALGFRKARRKEREGDGAQGDPKLYLEETLLERKLPDVDMRQVVELPDGLDYNEWLASHTLALFDHVNLIYGTVSEFCTPASCADMTGPCGRAYPWFDEKGKKTRVAAPQYIDYVMTFTQKTVSDENIFPTKYANEFPSSFESIVRKIVRLLFHVVAHLYAAHFREVALLRLHAHLNLTFAHLTALHRRFGLIEPKETEVLRDLELALRLTEESSAAGGAQSGGTSEGSERHSPPPAPGEPPPPSPPEPPRPDAPPA